MPVILKHRPGALEALYELRKNRDKDLAEKGIIELSEKSRKRLFEWTKRCDRSKAIALTYGAKRFIG